MMTGGIDSILNNRMAAGRQDPQYLMSSYQQNQDLIDLLALQKLKSEKEAAARQMALQGGGTPPTVREQREQELVEMNKQELAQQVGGVAQKHMADQQQAMQQLLQGIGSQNVPQFANGGIVGYQTGGEIEDEIVGYDGAGNPIYASHLARLVGDRVSHSGMNLPEDIAFAGERPLDAPPERITTLRGMFDKAKRAWPFEMDLEGSNVARVRETLAERGSSPITKAVAYPAAVVEDFLSGQRQIGQDIGEGLELAREGINIARNQAGEGLRIARGDSGAETSQQRSGGIGDLVGPVQRSARPRAQPVQMDMPGEDDVVSAMSPSGPRTAAEWIGQYGAAPAVEQRDEQPAQQGGIGSLAQRMQALEGRRDSGWGKFADWATGVATAPRRELGQALAGGARALRDREQSFDARLMDMLKTQQGMDLAERGVDIQQMNAETARYRAELEETLTREGWDREDMRTAADSQARVVQAALQQGLRGSDAARLYADILSKMPVGEDPEDWAQTAMTRTLEAMQLLGGNTLTNYGGPVGD